MTQLWILAIGAATGVAIGAAIVVYLEFELRRQRHRHTERSQAIQSSPKFMALNHDQQLSVTGYLIRQMDKADRKRIVFSTFSNTALAIGGIAPILAMLSSDPLHQKVLNAVSSVSVLCLGIFSLEKFAIEHRRAGYLIDSLIQEWLSEVGAFADQGDAEGFRTLVKKAKEVLDTGETSFIGAGSNAAPIEYKLPTVPQPLPVPKPQPTEPINHQSITNQLPTIAQTTQSPVTQSPNENITLDEFLDEDLGRDVDWNTAVTQGNEPVAPEDFAQWQATQLKGEK